MPNNAAKFAFPPSLALVPDGNTKILNYEMSGNALVAFTPASGEPVIVTEMTTWGDGANAGYIQLKRSYQNYAPLLYIDYSVGVGTAVFCGQENCRFVFADDMSLYIKNENNFTQCCGYSGVVWDPGLMGRDVISGDTNTAADSTLEITPPSGEEWLITTVLTFGDGVSSGWAGTGLNSSYNRYFLYPGFSLGEGDGTYATTIRAEVFVDNTNLLYIHNHSAGSKYLIYSGIKWRT